MRIDRHRSIVRVAFGLALVVLKLPAIADTGRVVDASTGKPLSGVHVYVRWDAEVFKGIESSHTCFRIAATTTDEAGQFNLSSRSWSVNPTYFNRQRTQFFYKVGYRNNGKTEQWQGTEVAMSPDDSIGRERLQYIFRNYVGTDCGDYDQQRRELIPLYRALLEESRTLATSPDLFAYLNSAQYHLEVLELGRDKATSNDRKRRIEWGVR